MAQFVVANNVNTQLAAALPSSGAGSTTVTLASSANLPTLNTAIGQQMPLTLNDAATGAIYETVYVTAISGATLTVLRGQEGTSALNWNVGDFAFCGPTAGTAGLATMRTQYQASASFSSSQTLTAAIAGESVGFTGTSAATFSMPAQSTVPSLTPTAVYNDGTAALTLTANGSDKFVVATGQVTSIVMQPGDDLSFYASSTSGLWQATAGSALRQYEPLVVGAATASQHAVQFGQVAGVVGSVRNLVMSVTAASATATLSADEIVVESALGGLRYCLPNFSKTINLATTGVGGMDTGTAPVSGYVALYAIYNPTTATAALLATNATSAVAPSVYGGANMPSGYTASGLVSVVPTNGSGQFVQGVQVDRTIYINRVQAVNSTTAAASSTSLNIASLVPKNAREVFGDVSASSTGTTLTISVGSSGAGTTNSPGLIIPTFYQVGQTYYKIPIITPQIIFYYFQQASGSFSGQVNIAGYTI
ncbi:hypothetical protein [Paraburkholderia caffeinilytica]|uniref:hypothetical protein n=1 Tax=Paraburkholderia caffeinilytica TaxID=1761016 RepID=UPI0038BB8972